MKNFTKRFSQSVAEPAHESPDSSRDEPNIHTVAEETHISDVPLSFRKKWIEACKQVFPLYFASHLAVLLIDCLAVLFNYTRPYQSYGSHYQQVPTPHISTLWTAWNLWPHDTPHFIEIAQHGYDQPWLTAFFPLYPLLIRIASPLTGNNFILAALLVSNLAGFVMLLVFYQLVRESFDQEKALRTILYFSIFPSAFFFMAGYTETTFLCFVCLSFYQMRHGRWWLAGLFGFLAALTRNTGVFLFIPFCYEYLRQHQFRLTQIRFNVFSAILIPAGMGAFMVYCYLKLRDALAFQHSETYWHHIFIAPWTGLMYPLRTILNFHQLLSFATQRSGIEIGSTFFILALLLLCVVGPWRLPRRYMAYIIFGAIVGIIPLFSPLRALNGPLPYPSLSRYMLEVFPAFILLAALGKYRLIHYTYLMVAGALFFFLLTQFLLGYMIT